jgi:hypothetical protein
MPNTKYVFINDLTNSYQISSLRLYETIALKVYGPALIVSENFSLCTGEISAPFNDTGTIPAHLLRHQVDYASFTDRLRYS